MHFGLAYFMAEHLVYGDLNIDLDLTSLDRISNNMGTYGPYMIFSLLWIFVLPSFGLPDLMSGLNYHSTKVISYPLAMFNLLTFIHSLTMQLCAVSWTLAQEEEPEGHQKQLLRQLKKGKQKFYRPKSKIA